MTIATTTLNQLTKGNNGINRLRAMVGAYNIVEVEGGCFDRQGGVRFNFKGSRKFNLCQIMLTENDLYDVNLWKVTPRTFKAKALTGVDCESLATVFTAETGLDTSL